MGGVTFTTLKDWVDTSWKAQGDARKAIEDDFAFEAGHQWTDEEKAEMDDKERATVVFNRAAVIIASVVGSEINNRTEVRYIPREIGDAKPNEVITAGGEWFRDESDAEDADSEAFEDCLICGLGITETSLDYEEDPEGKPTMLRIDPLEFGYDHRARRKGIRESRYQFRVIDMPSEEAKESFEGEDLQDIHADWINLSPQAQKNINHQGDEYKYDDGDDIENSDTVTVVQIQWRERKKLVEYVEPSTGKRAEMPRDQWEKLSKYVPLATAHRELTKWEWHQAFLGRDKILRRNQPNPDGCTFNVLTGRWDAKDKRWYGLLKSMKDPQKYANKWLSQILHILNNNAKGGVMMEAGAALDQKQFEESWAAADSVTWLKDGALAGGRFAEKPKAEMPAAFMALTEFAVTSIRDASGVNMELLGLRDANQPGVLEYQRRQSAMTTLARFFDSLRYYRKRQGDVIFHFLRNYIAPTGRLVRLVKEGQEQYVPLAMDEGTRSYDVIVDDAPSAPNEKEKAWSVIEAMMPMLQAADLSLDDWADILEYSPLPSSFVDKVREKVKAAENAPPAPQEDRLLEAEVMKTEAEAQKTMADAQARGSEAQMQQAEHAQRSQEIQAGQMETAMDG